MSFCRSILQITLGGLLAACGVSHSLELPESADNPPDTLAEGECPHWFLVERDGGPASYARLVYDEQMRVVRHERGNPSRSISGEYHQVVQTEYTEGRVSWTLDFGDYPELDGVIDFAETTELDEQDRPIRIAGHDVHAFRAPNRIESFEFEGELLRVRHQQDRYANGNTIDMRCTHEYNRRGQLETRTCPADTTRFEYDASGNLLSRRRETPRLTHERTYRYAEGLLVGSSSSFSDEEYSYGPNRRLALSRTERRDGLGGSRSIYDYDAQGRLSRHQEFELDATIRNTTTFRYDDQGRLIEEDSERTPRSYTYEETGESLTVTESWGTRVHQTRYYVCSQFPTTGLPVFNDPDPTPNGDPLRPDELTLPTPFPN